MLFRSAYPPIHRFDLSTTLTLFLATVQIEYISISPSLSRIYLRGCEIGWWHVLHTRTCLEDLDDIDDVAAPRIHISYPLAPLPNALLLAHRELSYHSYHH